MTTLSRNEFRYTEEPSTSWREKLVSLRDANQSCLSIPILWGAHEPTQGIRDFSKSSRLRLEKFLNLAQDLGLSVDARLGFPAIADSLPGWAFDLSNVSALVPEQLWQQGVGSLSLIVMPSIHEVELKSAFLEFVSDVATILALYQQPEGPLRSLSFDAGIFAHDLNAAEATDFPSQLQSLYGQVDELNVRYQTTFKDFISATSKQGMRTLFNKRPWLAAHDFKWCRNAMLVDLEKGVGDLAITLGLGRIFKSSTEWNETGSKEFYFRDRAMYFDATLLEGDEEKDVPAEATLLAPSGFVHDQAVNAFRLWRVLSQRAEAENIPFRLMKKGECVDPRSSGLLTAIVGRYLPRLQFQKMNEWVREGGKVFFPFGIPQYEEAMQRLDWGAEATFKHLRSGDFAFVKIERDRGQIWACETPLELDNQVWEKTHVAIGEIEMEMGR